MVPKHDTTRAKSSAYVYSDFPSRNNYIWGLSHNLYSENCGDKHKTFAAQHDSLTPWSDHRIQAILRPERRQEIAEAVFEVILFALFGAMLVFAYFS